jgi:putative membrane protein
MPVMETLMLRILVNAVGLWVATKLVDGIRLTTETTGETVVTLLVVALIFGVINAVIKPIVQFFTLPLFILTLGLITLLINGVMLLLTSTLSGQFDLGFQVTGLWAAVLGALVVSVVSFALNLVLSD